MTIRAYFTRINTLLDRYAAADCVLDMSCNSTLVPANRGLSAARSFLKIARNCVFESSSMPPMKRLKKSCIPIIINRLKRR